MTVIIRPAITDDEDDLFFMLLDMAAENSHHRVAVFKAISTIRDTIANGYVAVAEVDGKIIGSVGVAPRSDWFSKNVFLGDNWFYVAPDHRASRAAILLKDAVMTAAKKSNIELVMAVFSHTDPERKSEFIGRDMVFLGGNFMMEKV